ncbi:hypothetical protein HanPSC8_Chr04g0157721 [Helianthus annuus]|nr:hypothetical protein HanPSC8_Chr04g0157721 [Helianthus annuus]
MVTNVILLLTHSDLLSSNSIATHLVLLGLCPCPWAFAHVLGPLPTSLKLMHVSKTLYCCKNR